MKAFSDTCRELNYIFVLHAGTPYIHIFGDELKAVGNDKRTADINLPDDEKLKAEIERIKPLCKLQAKLYNQKMVKHEFLGSTRKQRTIYSDGTAVTVDFDRNTYEIKESENTES